uniref:Uncharacterized protein n=1 Tax=Populus trichocarpa TaxID=3694 RepID=A0A2K1Y3D3_POPTR
MLHCISGTKNNNSSYCFPTIVYPDRKNGLFDILCKCRACGGHFITKNTGCCFKLCLKVLILLISFMLFCFITTKQSWN